MNYKEFRSQVKLIKTAFDNCFNDLNFLSVSKSQENLEILADLFSNLLKDINKEKKELQNIDASKRKRNLEFYKSESWCSLCGADNSDCVEVKIDDDAPVICFCFSCINELYRTKQDS